MAIPLSAWDTAGPHELASLTFDSLTSDVFTVRGVRSASSWRQLSFRASGLTIELSVTATGPTRRLMGQLLPRQPAQVDIRHGDIVRTVEADALGRFTADDIPAGPLAIRCRLGPDASDDDTPPPVVTGRISV